MKRLPRLFPASIDEAKRRDLDTHAPGRRPGLAVEAAIGGDVGLFAGLEKGDGTEPRGIDVHETAFGVEIISTGGTAALLKENDIPVTLVEEITGFPEMLDGRVKTLHPKIHAAILADRDNPDHMRQLKEQGIEPIDMVVVNLYPFEKTVADPNCTFEQAIEMIDIGGPCMLRAAAKNHKHVLVVSAADSYDLLLEELRHLQDQASRDELFQSNALGAFLETTTYDAHVSTWLGENCTDGGPGVHLLQLWGLGSLRYGENPHQDAEMAVWPDSSPEEAELTASSEDENCEQAISYNNYADGHAALELCKELARARPLGGHNGKTICTFIKHTNACGVGLGDDPIKAYESAYLGDPNAALGGILACNFDIEPNFAQAVMDTYARWGK
ncbi:MAG: hypothetical protein IID54_00585, partial [Proteobacteria bacterium]|nr:hypothetical protein [Pseudomonadota bacterium]